MGFTCLGGFLRGANAHKRSPPHRPSPVPRLPSHQLLNLQSWRGPRVLLQVNAVLRLRSAQKQELAEAGQSRRSREVWVPVLRLPGDKSDAGKSSSLTGGLGSRSERLTGRRFQSWDRERAVVPPAAPQQPRQKRLAWTERLAHATAASLDVQHVSHAEGESRLREIQSLQLQTEPERDRGLPPRAPAPHASHP